MRDDKKEQGNTGRKVVKVIGIIAKILLFLLGAGIICMLGFTCYKVAIGINDCLAPLINMF